MRKLYLFVTALMCAVGVTSVNAQTEERELKLSSVDAQSVSNTAFNKAQPGADAVKNFFADDSHLSSTGMVFGVSGGASDGGWLSDLVDRSETGFSFRGRGGYGGESVSQMYRLYGKSTSLTGSFVFTSTETTEMNFSIWRVSAEVAECLKTESSWTSGNTYSFELTGTDENPVVDVNDRLVLIWNSGVAGKKITISEFEATISIAVDYNIQLSNLIGIAEDIMSKAEIGTEIGAYSQESGDALTAAIATAQGKLSSTVTEADVTALQTAIDGLTRNMPEPGKFYQLATWKAENVGKVAFANNENKCYWGFNETPAAVWVFEAADNGAYYLKNLATGSYMDNYTDNDGAPNVLIEKDETKTVAVEHSGEGRKVGIRVGNGKYLDRDQNGDNFPKGICHWGGAIEGNRMWLINEKNASDIKHTLSVGATGWATLVLGFNVTIPETEGVTVYAVESTSATEATLKPVTGVLPANTAVLVNAPAGTPVDFYYTEETATVSSQMTGTLYDKNITPEAGQTCYVLSNQDGVTAFYKAELNQESAAAFKNNANKAYLPVATTTSAGAPSLNFVFGTETSIEGVEAAKAGKSAVYDLSGRRVKSAVKGIYIINGKKVVK